MKTIHRQVRLGPTMHVDRGIARLIDRLWHHAIFTLNSCQENKPGIMWIEFKVPHDAEQFLGRILQKDVELYKLLMEEIGDTTSFAFYPTAVPHLAPTRVVLNPSIRFSLRHYRRLLKVFQ